MILRFSSTQDFKDGDEIPFDLLTKDGKSVRVIINAKWVQEVGLRNLELKHYVCEGSLEEMNFS